MNKSDFSFQPATGRWCRFSKEELLDALRRLGVLLGNRGFMIREFDAWPDRPCTPDTIIYRFGSWPKALAAVGLSPVPRRKYSPEELIANLEAVWLKRGREPSRTELVNLGPISTGPYERHWGSLKIASTLLAQHKRGRITRDQLLAGRAHNAGRTLRHGLRWRIFARDKFRCVVCGRKGSDKVVLEVDHIIPVSKGGPDHPSNLRTLCLPCNRGRGAASDTAPRRTRAA